MAELRKRIKSSKDGQQERVNELNRQFKKTEERQQRLLEAIEMGVIELDETTQRRAQQVKAAREALIDDGIIKMGNLNQVPIFNLDWRPLRDSNSCYRRERAVS